MSEQLEKWAHKIALRAVVDIAVRHAGQIGPGYMDDRGKILADDGYTAARDAVIECFQSEPEVKAATERAQKAAYDVFLKADSGK